MKHELKPEHVEFDVTGRETLAEMWDKFAARAVPAHAPPEKVKIVKNAFYNGMYCAIIALGGYPQTTSDLQRFLKRLDEVATEVNRYYSSITPSH